MVTCSTRFLLAAIAVRRKGAIILKIEHVRGGAFRAPPPLPPPRNVGAVSAMCSNRNGAPSRSALKRNDVAMVDCTMIKASKRQYPPRVLAAMPCFFAVDGEPGRRNHPRVLLKPFPPQGVVWGVEYGHETQEARTAHRHDGVREVPSHGTHIYIYTQVY